MQGVRGKKQGARGTMYMGQGARCKEQGQSKHQQRALEEKNNRVGLGWAGQPQAPTERPKKELPKRLQSKTESSRKDLSEMELSNKESPKMESPKVQDARCKGKDASYKM